MRYTYPLCLLTLLVSGITHTADIKIPTSNPTRLLQLKDYPEDKELLTTVSDTQECDLIDVMYNLYSLNMKLKDMREQTSDPEALQNIDTLYKTVDELLTTLAAETQTSLTRNNNSTALIETVRQMLLDLRTRIDYVANLLEDHDSKFDECCSKIDENFEEIDSSLSYHSDNVLLLTK